MSAGAFEVVASAEERAAVFARVRALCTLPDGEGGCWIWAGSGGQSSSARPTMHFRGRAYAVRRVVFFLQHGFEVPAGMSATGCGVPGCVAPGCVHALPPTAVMRRSAKAGRCSTPEAQRARKAAAQRRARIDPEVVELVRALDCSGAEAARITGMSKAHAINIRSGRARTPLDAPVQRPRGTRQQAATRRAAAAAAQRNRQALLGKLAQAAEVAGIWRGLL